MEASSLSLANGVLYTGNGKALRASTGMPLATLWSDSAPGNGGGGVSVGLGEVARPYGTGVQLYGLPAKG
jgi:hypothetical protein